MTQPACIAAIAAAMLFADSLAAQRQVPWAPAAPPRPAPPPRALPSTPPPVDHPALSAQPLMQRDDDEDSRKQPMCDEDGRTTAASAEAEVVDEVVAAAMRAREFSAVRVAGAELEARVDTVVENLNWHDDMLDARAEAAATGRPVLWIQSLGDIDGFA